MPKHYIITTYVAVTLALMPCTSTTTYLSEVRSGIASLLSDEAVEPPVATLVAGGQLLSPLLLLLACLMPVISVAFNRFFHSRSTHKVSKGPVCDVNDFGSSSKAPIHEQEVDVAIVGADVSGLMTALFCQQKCQQDTSIVVLDRLDVPHQTIGESGLSTLSRATQVVGLPLDMQCHLFGVKSGLTFYHVDDQAFHSEITNLDFSFQYDRRALALLLQELAKRRGIKILTGFQVCPVFRRDGESDSMLHDDGLCHLDVKDRSSEKRRRLKAKVIVNASGRKGMMQGKFRKPYTQHDGVKEQMYFNTNSVWAHFKASTVAENEAFKRLNEPTTKHISFKEGWLWMIRLLDWTRTDATVLRAYVNDLLDVMERRKNGEDVEYVSVEQLSEKNPELKVEFVYSLGFVIRDDMDLPKGSNYERFMHWVNKYDMVRAAVCPYLDQPMLPKEGGSFTTHGMTALAGFNTMPIRDGCIHVGDAAAFNNPFFSRGMNVGVVGCVGAAEAIADGLAHSSMKFFTQPTNTQNALVGWLQTIIPALAWDFVGWHTLMADAQSFGEILMARWTVSVADLSQYHTEEFSFKDELHAFGLVEKYLQVAFVELIVRMGADGRKTADVREAIRNISARLKRISREKFKAQEFGLYFPGHDDSATYRGVQTYDDKIARLGVHNRPKIFKRTVQCAMCKNWSVDQLRECFYCGAQLEDAYIQVVRRAVANKAVAEDI